MNEINVLLTFCSLVQNIKPSYILINRNVLIKTTFGKQNYVGRNNDAKQYFVKGTNVELTQNSGITTNVVEGSGRIFLLRKCTICNNVLFYSS